jgi:PD-(D/E)XK nuclease superfamily
VILHSHLFLWLTWWFGVIAMALRAGVEIVSHTELACFRRCPMEWRYRYVLRREPKGPKSQALTKGSAVHKVIGAYHRGENPDLSELSPDLRALVKGYRAYWGSPDIQFACERTDVPFQIMIDPTIMIVGEFDGTGIRRDTNKRAIQEIKTSSEDISLGSSYWNKVALVDSQVTSYLLASRTMGWGHVEVLYDVLLKPDIKRQYATPADKRKYTKATKTEPSRLYADQREKDEDEEDFEIRVLEDIEKRPEHYYQRGVVVRLEHEHEAHVRDVKGTVHLLQIVRNMGEDTPRNTDSCFKYGRPCDFFQVCGGGIDVMDDNFYQPKTSSRQRAKVEQEPEQEKRPRFVF